MHSLSFVHAADLHLGAPFKGLDSSAAAVFPLAEASFTALANLEKVCLESKAAFLILSGDVYDGKDGVLRARFALRDMFRRLGKEGIRVFLAHGNHDPFFPGKQPVTWPENVTVFPPDGRCECVSRDGRILALVHGISHGKGAETENLSLRLKPFRHGSPGVSVTGLQEAQTEIPEEVFQIAVLHCAVGGAGEGHAPYAPCSLTDLTAAGFDYWALGHVHQGKVLSEKPWVVYPGSIQGLHVNETGLHGCTVVRVDGSSAVVESVPLAPVLWQSVAVDATGMETLEALEGAIVAALEAAHGAAVETDTGVKALFCRIVIQGRTGLDGTLQKRTDTAHFLERIRGMAVPGLPCWIKDIAVNTRPLRDTGSLAERNDLVGEIARSVSGSGFMDEAVARALSTVQSHHKLKKVLAGSAVLSPTPADAVALAESAKSLVIALLEDE